MKPELLNGKCPLLGCEFASLWEIARTGRKIQNINEKGELTFISDEFIYQCAECKSLYTSYGK